MSKLIRLGVLVLLAYFGCIRIHHLGDKTGKAYKDTFDAQIRGEPSHKEMETELATKAANKMVECCDNKTGQGVGTQGAGSRPPRLPMIK